MTRCLISDLHRIFKSSIRAVLPESLIRPLLKYDHEQQQLTIIGDNYNLNNKNLYLIGAGKAVQSMAREIEYILHSKIKEGIISIPVGSTNYKGTVGSNITYYEGAKNNLPDANAEMTAKKTINLVSKLASDDLLLVLISGGGSALWPLAKPPITLEEKTAIIRLLANCGADIKELNTVRKRLSDIKGGELCVKAQPAQIISLILSDIVGDPLDLIASGPTTENEDDPLNAIHIISKYNLNNDLPESVKIHLNNVSNVKEFPKDKVKNYIIGSNKISIAAALEEARNLDYLALDLSSMITGNVKNVASEYVKVANLFCLFLKGIYNLPDLIFQIKTANLPGIDTSMLEGMNKDSFHNKNLCLIFGGETTVDVIGSGKGGRNQQLVLEFSSIIDQVKHEFEEFDIFFLSAGTDGIDGPTDAAGAIGYVNLISEAGNENFNVQKYLDHNDSYNFFKAFDQGRLHVITGHTNTNVMDIHLLVIRRK